MTTKDINIDNIISDVIQGKPIRKICKEHHIGEKRLRKILSINEIDLSKRKRAVKYQPPKSLIGKKFNHLSIIGFEHKDDKCWWMKVKCDCGNETFEVLRKLKNGKRKTCGLVGCKYFHKLRKDNGRKANFTGYEDIYGARWAHYQCSAKKRNIAFNINIEYAWEIFLKQDKKCALSGVPIEFGNSYNKTISASLDRINSKKGYIKDNIQWVHKHINIMKRDLSDEEFIKWCTKVSSHRTPIE